MSNDGLVYVATGVTAVSVFTLTGSIRRCSSTADKSAATASRIALVAARIKFLYVSDFGNGHIFIVDRKSLEVVGQFGQQRKGTGKLHARASHHDRLRESRQVNPGARGEVFRDGSEDRTVSMPGCSGWRISATSSRALPLASFVRSATRRRSAGVVHDGREAT